METIVSNFVNAKTNIRVTEFIYLGLDGHFFVNVLELSMRILTKRCSKFSLTHFESGRML